MTNALQLFEENEKEGLTTDTITYSSAISACEKAGGNDGMTNSLTLLKIMKDSGMLNDELEQTTLLNLHENAFFSKQTWEKIYKKAPSRRTHIPGIHPALAQAMP